MIPVGPFRGRLARTPKFEFVGQNQTPKWQATLAHDLPRWDAQTRSTVVGTLWVMVQAWGSQAEELHEQAYDQGDELFVHGELSQFTVGEGDKKETKTHVTALLVHCLRRKSPRPGVVQPPTGGGANDSWGATQQPPEPPF